ncbi:phytoene/squalene synthase family protein [Sphingobacterium oryzagri]|uniref:Phytoene/squalene synthase family protein n=1 Tax=Sphingobacterium oryzagri TaxID=3025669 RepID=A0ABY7WM00_9SPHI|nr:phytoene/squalene synthase family protein [Sphingobacterium sp. KACC 22765]WDF70035.1 phytoene/squalene synthase family protein [Sphingobacterium sp. KACC 22765]
MKKLFDELAFQISKETTKKYSTSFSLGILALDAAIRPAIYAIYGFVRLADEIVDSFHGYDRRKLLDRLKDETDYALEHGISVNPILQSFQETYHRYGLERKLVDQFMESMAMDLEQIDYNDERYSYYILGSAEVVGLMCLHVFVDGDKEKFASLKPFAMKLGSAFQKVNFLRDLRDDYRTLGRTYFPNVDMGDFNNEMKIQIEADIAAEFREALSGIKRLPSSSKFGVYLAYRYYLSLFRKIKNTSAQHILNQRVRIPNGRKISLMMSSYVQYKMAIL